MNMTDFDDGTDDTVWVVRSYYGTERSRIIGEYDSKTAAVTSVEEEIESFDVECDTEWSENRGLRDDGNVCYDCEVDGRIQYTVMPAEYVKTAGDRR